MVGRDVSGAPHDVDPGHDLVGADRVARDPWVEDPVNDAEDVVELAISPTTVSFRCSPLSAYFLWLAAVLDVALLSRSRNLLLQEAVPLGREELGQFDDPPRVQLPADRGESFRVVRKVAIGLGDESLGRHARELNLTGLGADERVRDQVEAFLEPDARLVAQHALAAEMSAQESRTSPVRSGWCSFSTGFPSTSPIASASSLTLACLPVATLRTAPAASGGVGCEDVRLDDVRDVGEVLDCEPSPWIGTAGHPGSSRRRAARQRRTASAGSGAVRRR